VLMPEFCVPQSPALELHETGQHAVFALPNDEDALQGGVTISSAFFVRNGSVAGARTGRKRSSASTCCTIPASSSSATSSSATISMSGASPSCGSSSPRRPAPRRRARRIPPPAHATRPLHPGGLARAWPAPGRRGRRFPALAPALPRVPHGRSRSRRFRGYRSRIMYP
jgi:hypothetical protein